MLAASRVRASKTPISALRPAAGRACCLPLPLRRCSRSVQAHAGEQQYPPSSDGFNAAAMSTLHRRIEELKMSTTLRFLERGYQASILETVAESLIDERPPLPAVPPASPAWETMEVHGDVEALARWHEEAWQQLAQVVKGEDEDVSA